MKPYLLGIDIGTSACKIAVFDRKGQVRAASSGEYPVYYPKEGQAEQNPEEWWGAVCGAVKDALVQGNIKPEEIAGIGIDGQSLVGHCGGQRGKCPCKYADLDGYEGGGYLCGIEPENWGRQDFRFIR